MMWMLRAMMWMLRAMMWMLGSYSLARCRFLPQGPAHGEAVERECELVRLRTDPLARDRNRAVPARVDAKGDLPAVAARRLPQRLRGIYLPHVHRGVHGALMCGCDT
eukprot:5133483-Pyramimonas_sp.AAC.1